MAKQRTTLQAEDLENRALILHSKSGHIYRLGPPKKKNVNLNVVNHCQIYSRNGHLAGDGWYNLTNLREAGYKLYTPTKQLPLKAERGGEQP